VGTPASSQDAFPAKAVYAVCSARGLPVMSCSACRCLDTGSPQLCQAYTTMAAEYKCCTM
jgi:hypothetical protein